MRGGTDHQSLRRIAERLVVEFTDDSAPGFPGLPPSLGAVIGADVLPEEQEATVARLRDALTAVAENLSSAVDDSTMQMVQIALDGAEFIIRGELFRGNHDRVLALLPSFVFLVALTVADRDRALALSRRTEELTKDEFT